MSEVRLKPLCLRADALAVLQRLREQGHIAYFAGGCVRDVLLGLEPKDYDIATDAPPKRVRQLFSNTQAVGQAFGVILVRQGKSVIEVATFRSEGSYTDGRRPDHVTFSTPQDDAQRRDFTINGLFLDPLEKDRVIDYVGGLEDLRSRRLRAIGQPGHRFAEDHLRLLRAVRFAARFGLQIEPSTAAAIERDAPLLQRISPERIADELRLMLTPPTRGIAYELLWHFELAPVVLRFLDPPARERPGHAMFARLAPGESIAFGLALAAIVVEVRLPQLPMRPQTLQAVRALRQGLKISNDESEMLEEILLSIHSLLTTDDPTVAALKRFLAGPSSTQTRQLLAALLEEGLCAQRIAQLLPHLNDLAQGDCAPPPLVTGDDLQAMGLPPGPLFKTLLDQTYDAQLEGRVISREQALDFVRGLPKT